MTTPNEANEQRRRADAFRLARELLGGDELVEHYVETADFLLNGRRGDDDFTQAAKLRDMLDDANAQLNAVETELGHTRERLRASSESESRFSREVTQAKIERDNALAAIKTYRAALRDLIDRPEKPADARSFKFTATNTNAQTPP